MKGIIRELKKNRWNYIFVLPAGIYTFLFGYATLPYLIIAFEKFNYQTGIFSKWVGFENFRFFFGSTRAWEVTRNTVLLNFYYLLFGTVITIALALLINELKSKYFLKVAQSTMLFPYFISWVVVSYILFALLSTDYGWVNSLLDAWGFERIRFYTDPKYWRFIIVASRIWKMAGYNSIIYLAVIAGIDKSLYEAAAIDGASRWQSVSRITIPLMMPTVCILLLMEIGKMFYGDFGMVYALIKDAGHLYPAVDVIDTYVFRLLRTTGDPSMSMAVGLYQSAVGFCLVFLSNYIIRKKYPDGALF